MYAALKQSMVFEVFIEYIAVSKTISIILSRSQTVVRTQNQRVILLPRSTVLTLTALILTLIIYVSRNTTVEKMGLIVKVNAGER